MIDTHCHLTFKDFAGRLDEELALCERHGVTGAISISTTSVDCEQALALAEADPRVWCSSGVHPLHADEGPHDWETIARCARSDRCVAWGELGLDNHYDEPPSDVQHRVLHEQLAVIEGTRKDAGEIGLGKPVVIHCRQAFEELIPLLASSSISADRFVFHCFTGNEREARMVLDFGALISLTGVVTYKNAKDLQAAALLIPLDRLMVETDAPFLSPMPHRGERPCHPWMSSLTARFLAKHRGESWDVFHAAINENTQRFFGIDATGATP